MFVSGAALALASCGRPDQQIVPYVQIPEGETPGVALRFATALPLAGYGRGVVVNSVEGRPIKIEGNPRHPASLGATDVFAEATLLSLYDPDRSKAPYSDGRIQPWSAFQAALLSRLERKKSRGGAGLALLTGRVTSPTLIAQIDSLTRALPQTKWYCYKPVEDDVVAAGAAQAFGRPAAALPRFGETRVLLALDADPLGCGPEQIRFGHDIIGARQSRTLQESLRLYVVEPAWTLTGAQADHRIALRPELVRNVAWRSRGRSALPFPPRRCRARPINSRRSPQLILSLDPAPPWCWPDHAQGADVHALCHWINHALGAPIDFIGPIDPVAAGYAGSLRALADAVHSGGIETLIIIGANPAYDAPGELRIADLIASVPFSAHLGLYHDETAARCTWRLPLSHVLESWSDIRATDGTASIIQPLIRPLYDSRTAHDLIALIGGGPPRRHMTSFATYGARPTGRPAISRTGGSNRCRTA